MNRWVKKGLELGAGVTYITAEAALDAIEKLEKQGRIDKDEGRRMINELFRKSGMKESKMKKEIGKQISSMIKASPFATKKEMTRLNAKIDKLNSLLKKKRR